MNQLEFLKNLPTPVRMLIRPMLYVSLSLHGLFLLIPIASNSPPNSSAEEPEERVAISQLAPSPSPSPTVQTPKPTPSPTVQTPPTLAPVPSPILTVQPPSPTPKRPSPPLPPPEAIAPEPTPTPQVEETPDPFLGQELFETPEPTPSPEVAQSPEPTPTPEVTPTPEISPTPEPTPIQEVTQTPEPTPEFPHVAGAQHGCNNNIALCWKADGERSTSVARNLQASLEAQGFSVTRVDGDRTGERIYEVSKDGEIHYYISLFSTLDGGTQYAIADEPLTLEELQEKSKTEAPN